LPFQNLAREEEKKSVEGEGETREDRGQRTEDRGQRTEDRGQRKRVREYEELYTHSFAQTNVNIVIRTNIGR
jgi:hypothetical protein